MGDKIRGMKVGQIISALILLGIALTPQVNTSETISETITATFTWEEGDDYAYQGLGRYGQNSSYTIIGKTMWHGQEVFNVSTQAHYPSEGFELNYTYWNYHTTDTYDVIGYDSVEYSFYYQNKSNTINSTTWRNYIRTEGKISSDYQVGSSSYSIGMNGSFKTTYYPNQWQTIPLGSAHYTNYSSTMNYTEEISEAVLTTALGTFDCWKITDGYSHELIQNSTILDQGGNTSYHHGLNQYTPINQTHSSVYYQINDNGTISDGTITMARINSTNYLSKDLGIIISSTHYYYVQENQTWEFWVGQELVTLNTQNPLITTTSPPTTTTISTETDTTEDSSVTTQQSTTSVSQSESTGSPSTTSSTTQSGETSETTTNESATTSISPGWTFVILLPLIAGLLVRRKEKK